MKPTLNLGCGPDNWGDYRIDVDSWNGNTNYILDFDEVNLHLPFEDKFFSECRCFHVLEHLNHPAEVLKEALRVSDVVHCKFPTKWNRIPGTLGQLTSLMLWRHHKGIWAMLWCFYEPFLHDHPQKHRHTIIPTGDYHLNKMPIPRLLIWRRFPWYFKNLIIWIPLEWECFIK
jgi:SAM-dependent methyltransferase